MLNGLLSGVVVHLKMESTVVVVSVTYAGVRVDRHFLSPNMVQFR